jgi:hypothetical protein
MKRRILILIVGLLLLAVIFSILKKTEDSSFLQETEKELFEMKLQKDSVFQMAEEITKFTEDLKHTNDSLCQIKPKDNLKIVEKQVIVRDTVKVVDEENMVKAMPLRNDFEIDRLKEELRMTRWTIYNLYSERDSLVIKLENLQKELDSLKIKK